MRFPLFLALLFLSPLTAQTAFVTGSGYVAPPAIAVAPGQIATFYVGGLPQTATALQNTIAQLSNAGVTEAAPVLSAKPFDAFTLAITVQIPFDVAPGAAAESIQFGQVNSTSADPCTQNVCSAPVSLTVVQTIPHIISTCDVFYSVPAGSCQLVITHQNGSLVTYAAPAKGGEVLTIWALGLGVPISGVPAPGSGPIAMNDIVLYTGFEVTAPGSPYDTTLSSSTPYLWAGLPSPATGLYQINFAVPQPPSTLQGCTQSTEWFIGGGNLSVSIFRNITVAPTTPVLNMRVGNLITFLAAGPDAVSSICVAL